jgi:hypothetical protein
MAAVANIMAVAADSIGRKRLLAVKTGMTFCCMNIDELFSANHTTGMMLYCMP